MKLMISVFMIGLLIGVFAFYCISFLTNQPSRREKALNYLVDSYNSTIGLCFESPGSNVYWLSHDNILASYELQQLNATVANNITETVRRIGREYNLAVAETGLPVDCKLRALLVYNVNFFFNDTEKVIINGSYYGSILKTETDQANPLIFTNYTDTLCYASFVEWRRQNFSGANYYFEQARAKWDGIGFNDSAYDPTKGYDTYKLGLFYWSSKTLDRNFDFKKDLIETVWSCQVENGGFKTNYFSKGNPTPVSKTNTETTSIILLSELLSSN